MGINKPLDQLNNTRYALKKMAILNLGVCSTCQYCNTGIDHDDPISYTDVESYGLYKNSRCGRMHERCSEIRSSLSHCDYHKLISSKDAPKIKKKVVKRHSILNIFNSIIYSLKINDFGPLKAALNGEQYEPKT